MLKIENEKIANFDFVHTFSDSGFMIRQESTGTLYSDAWDLSDHPQEYTETDEPIEQVVEEEVV